MTTKNTAAPVAPVTPVAVDTPALTLVQMTSGRVYLFGAPAEVAPATLGFFGAKPAAAKPAAAKPAAESREDLLAELLSLSPQFGGMAKTKNWGIDTIRARIDAIRAGAPASTRGGKKSVPQSKPAAEKPAPTPTPVPQSKPAAEKPAPTPTPAPQSKPFGKSGGKPAGKKYPEAFHDLEGSEPIKVLVWNAARTKQLKVWATCFDTSDAPWVKEKNATHGVDPAHQDWVLWIVQGYNSDRKSGFLFGNKRSVPYCDYIREFDWKMSHERDIFHKD